MVPVVPVVPMVPVVSVLPVVPVVPKTQYHAISVKKNSSRRVKKKLVNYPLFADMSGGDTLKLRRVGVAAGASYLLAQLNK